jgi:hypothetical protein
MNKKLAIYGTPRSGTKLLAALYQQQGYHNFGEFFDTFSSTVVPGSSVARRLTPEEIKEIWVKRTKGSIRDDEQKRLQTNQRIAMFDQYKDIESSIVTVWSSTFYYRGNLLSTTLSDRYFLCTRRRNRLEHLKSIIVATYNHNFDGTIESRPVTAKLDDVVKWVVQMIWVERRQDYIVSQGRGRYIDFDKLITGTEDLGFEYSVNSIDEHPTLDNLIINLNEVTELIDQIKNIVAGL